MSEVRFTADNDLTNEDGTYLLTKEDARKALWMIEQVYPAYEFLNMSHEDRICLCAASLTKAQDMDPYSGFLIYLADTDSFAYDVAHAVAHFMEDYYRHQNAAGLS